MGVGGNVAPVIIKRKKVVGGGGHHGGAWKVAYADFVTAMMAFFMLMWLLNATTEKQRKGIADYFSPTVPINRVSGGGDGTLGGHSIFAENTLPRVGTGATSLRPTALDNASGGMSTAVEPSQEEAEAEELALKKVEEHLMGRGGETMLDDNLMRHVVTRLTDEGLIIELFDAQGERLFTDDNEATPLLKVISEVLVRVSAIVSNEIAIESHVSSVPVVVARNPVWNTAAGRGDILRALMEQAGLRPERINRVTSHADREPVSDNPMHMRNNRLEVIFLRK